MGAHMPLKSTCADAGRTPTTAKNPTTMMTPTVVGFMGGNITTGGQPVRDSTVDSTQTNVSEGCTPALSKGHDFQYGLHYSAPAQRRHGLGPGERLAAGISGHPLPAHNWA